MFVAVRETLLVILYGICSVSDIREKKIYLLYFLIYGPLVLICVVAEGISFMNLAMSFIPGAMLLFVSKMSRGSVGMGDVYLVMAAGPALLLDRTLICLTYAFVGAAVAGGMIMLIKKCDVRERIPLAPFMLAATVAVIAEQILMEINDRGM